MRSSSWLVSSLAVVAAAAIPATAHHGAPAETAAPSYKVEKLTERSWCLYGQGGNVGVYATGAGLVVIDDQYEKLASALVDQIKSLSAEPIRYVVSTHYHDDHTGGNTVFIKLAEIVAHDNVRPRMLEYPSVVTRTFPARMQALEKEIASIADAADPYRVALEKDLGLAKFFLDSSGRFDPVKAAPPGLTYDRRVTLWTGGKAVDLIHVGPGHTDGDTMVYLRDEKVLHMGDLFFNGTYPFVDTAAGGSVAGWIENIDSILAVVPADVKVIPGHGPVTDVAGLRRLRSFFADLRGKVSQAAAKGTSRIEAVRSIRMDEYPDIKPSFRTLGNIVMAVFDELAAAR